MYSVISEAIVKSFMEDFVDSIELDVAMVGADPAANAVLGGPRMGPIFSGMLRFGEKVARMISQRLEEGDLD